MYGTIPQEVSNKPTNATSQYALDGGPLAGTSTVVSSPQTQYHQEFFSSQPLVYGTHKLHILNTLTSGEKLWLDFFVVNTGLDANTSSIPSVPGLPHPTESTSTTSKAHSKSWIIAVSLAAGGCVILAALILIARHLKQRQREKLAAQIPNPLPREPLRCQI